MTGSGLINPQPNSRVKINFWRKLTSLQGDICIEPMCQNIYVVPEIPIWRPSTQAVLHNYVWLLCSDTGLFPSLTLEKIDISTNDVEHINQIQYILSPTSNISSMCAFGSNIFVAGGLSWIVTQGNVVNSGNAAIWNGTAWTPLYLDELPVIYCSNDSLVMAYSSTGSTAFNVVRYSLNLHSTELPAVNTKSSPTPTAICMAGKTIFVATWVLQTQSSVIYKWSGDAWEDFSFTIPGSIFALKVNSSRLFIGGLFTFNENINIAVWNLELSQFEFIQPTAEGFVLSLEIGGEYLYIGGTFLSAGHASSQYLAACKEDGIWIDNFPGAENPVFQLLYDPERSTLFFLESIVKYLLIYSPPVKQQPPGKLKILDPKTSRIQEVPALGNIYSIVLVADVPTPEKSTKGTKDWFLLIKQFVDWLWLIITISGGSAILFVVIVTAALVVRKCKRKRGYTKIPESSTCCIASFHSNYCN